MTGKIIKGIAGSYCVHVAGAGIYECSAKGIFRYKALKPLVGDNVRLEILDENDKKGNITEIMERKNVLIRPAAANISQAMVIFAIKAPSPNFNLLDRFLAMLQKEGVPVIICINKCDLAVSKELESVEEIYKKAGFNIIFTSTLSGEGMDRVRELLKNKTTIFAGPSGVGKSSMLNALMPDMNVRTGEISKKIERGKHTTRHTEIYNVEGVTYVMDTPGFSSVYALDIEKEELKEYFPEFESLGLMCRFNGCVHVGEPDCRVKEAVAQGLIAKSRYENYILMYEEIKNRKKRY